MGKNQNKSTKRNLPKKKKKKKKKRNTASLKTDG